MSAVFMLSRRSSPAGRKYSRRSPAPQPRASRRLISSWVTESAQQFCPSEQPVPNMNSELLIAMCAMWCAAVASAAPGPIHVPRCPDGMVLVHGDRCLSAFWPEDAEYGTYPELTSDTSKHVRAKRMVGMFVNGGYGIPCPKGLVRLTNGECVPLDEPLPGYRDTDFYYTMY